MLLAYFSSGNSEGDSSSLCLISEKLENKYPPVGIDALSCSEAGVFYIGHQESVVVEIDKDERAKIIRPVPPAAIVLTPNSPEQPGFRVFRIKVIYGEDNKLKTFYCRDHSSKWEPWVPYTKTF
ncbi:MAG: hypothetical protein IT291_01585 [Deltaproteobacteria bacterium]|nr:hypothetical protein [Deltaproteobacteria bacterium]